MLFNSPHFLFLFLPIILLLYYIGPAKSKNTLLLLASLFFYGWGEPIYICIMIFTIVITYIVGLLIHKFESGEKLRFILLFFGVVSNLGLLIFFKYFSFLLDNINILLNIIGVGVMKFPKSHLPLGISFFTFQSISYIVDTYRKIIVPEKSFVKIALYISFFPQLIAGPIVQFRYISKEIKERKHSISLISEGMKIFIIGLSKKIILANPLGLVADNLFALNSNSLTMSLSWIAVLSFSLQVYFDFSGYSDMAIGLGKMFGFRLPVNFNYPYISKSIGEFWSRWHITLTTWFREYVYYSLGVRVSNFRLYLNVLIVFSLTGLWHGAHLHFILFGIYHGIFLVIEMMGLSVFLKKCWSPFQHAYLLFVVFLGMIIFRSESITQAKYIFVNMFNFTSRETTHLEYARVFSIEFIVALIIGLLLCCPIYPLLKKISTQYLSDASNLNYYVCKIMSMIFFMSVFFLCILKIANGSHQPFIYFRF